MVRFSILGRYVLRELVASFLFCLGVFLAAGLIAGFLPLLRKVMEAGLPLGILFQVLVHALPGMLVTVLPLSIMIGILLGLGRMAADNEISAIKSAGISVVRLLPPVLIMGLVGLGFSLACTLVLIPRGIGEGRRLMKEALLTRADAGIEERTFFDSLKNLVLYVEKIDPATGVMNRIFIRESSNPDEVTVILAEQGKASSDPAGRALILELRNGTILTENRDGESTGSVGFETYAFRHSLAAAGLDDQAAPLEERSIGGIREEVARITVEKETDTPQALAYYERVRVLGRILIAQRFTYPLACLALALTAFPLGVINMAGSRLNNVAVGLAVIFAYYVFALAAERLARSYVAPPEMVMPLPPLLFSAAALYLTLCVRNERVPAILESVKSLVLRVRRREP